MKSLLSREVPFKKVVGEFHENLRRILTVLIDD